PAPSPAPSWGGGNAAAPTASTVVAGPSYAKPLPPGFDAAGFAAQAKLQFNRIQAAWDAADRAALADVMTPEMLAEVSRDLVERGPHRATEVATLGAEVLEVTTEGGRHWASVRYTGVLREDGAEQAKPFDEVWNLTKPVDGRSGWLLAGIQQLA
ncbi:MAG: Tim44-like domain-containing protein, partial [Betaproteobacteria bacterium]